MANGTNIVLGAEIGPYVAAIGRAQTATATFAAAFRQQFGSLSGAAAQPEGAFSRLNRTLTATKAQIRDLLASGAQVPQELQQRFALLQGQMDGVNGAFSRTGATSSNVLGGISGAAAGLFSVGAALNAIKTGLSIISDFQRLDSGLKAVSLSSGDFARSQQFLLSLANDLGISYETLAASYRGLKAATNGTSLEGKQTEAIFSAVVRAGAALKLSNDDIRGSLLALQQMMSKGTVSAEELRGQLGERIPGAFKLMANALGVTQPQLNKMLQTGQVMAEDALPKLAAELEKTYGAQAQANVASMAGGMARATDQAKLFVAEFGQTNGVDSFFTKLTNRIADTIKGLRQLNKDAAKGIFDPDATVDEGKQKSDELDRYKSYTQALRKAKRDILKEDIEKSQKDLAQRTSLTVIESPQIKADRRALENKRQLYRELQREELKLQVAERQAADQQSKVAPKAVATPTLTLKEQLKAVNKEIDAITAKGGANVVPPALLARAKELRTEIKRIQDATRPDGKPKAAKAEREPATELEFLTAQIKRVGNEVAKLEQKPLRLRTDEEKAKIAKLRGLIGLLIDDKKKLDDLMSGTRTNLPEVKNKLKTSGSAEAVNDVLSGTKGLNAHGLTDLLGGIEENVRKNRIRIKEDMNGAKADFASLPKFLQDLAGPLNQAAQTLFGAVGDGARSKIADLSKITDAFTQTMKEAGAQTLVAIGESLGKGNLNPLKQMLQTVLDVIGNYLIQIGTALLFAATVATTAAAAPTPASPLLALFGGNSQVAGASLLVGGGLVKGLAASAFAAGGMVSGPTLGLIGEYPGARHNKEFIAPVSTAKGFIREAVAEAGGGGGGASFVRGGDIYLSQQRTAKRRARVG